MSQEKDEVRKDAVESLMRNTGPYVESVVRGALLDVFKAQIEAHARGQTELEELSIVDLDSVGSW